jgi:vancomycin resistance protein YoaR
LTDVPITVARSIRRRRRRWPLALAALGILVLGGLAAALLTRTIQYRNETMPGVRVLGRDVGGHGRPALERRIEQIVGARLAQPVTVLFGKKTLTVRPDRLLAVNAAATVEAALRAGQASFLSRSGTLLSPVVEHRDVVPVLRIRRVSAGVFLADLRKLGTPARDATVRMDGLRPVVTAARTGTVPLGNQLLAALERQVLAGGRAVRVSFRSEQPAIATLAAKVAAAEVTTLVSGPVALSFDGQDVGSLSPSTLAALLRFHRQGTGYSVVFAPKPLTRQVEPFVKRFETEPKDASFAVDGELAHVVPAEPGRKLDPGAASFAVAGAARKLSGRTAPLSLSVVQPELTTAEAGALGIRRQLTSFTTQMGTSSSNRIHNVHLMADFIDGTLIGSGETFSFNKVVGPRTAARGFLEGQQIIGSLTLPAIGGGVCQTATTLFNDAFENGLPVIARINHNYYLSHYPLGRDATVSWGGPDLVFKNDLEHAILIKTSYTDSTLTFAFYGTPQGRKIESVTSPQTNWRDPTTGNAYDPSGQIARPGQVVTMPGSGERGFDVTVSRTVTQNGDVIRKDSFFSRYVPVGNTIVYGPGRKPPPPYIVIPATD